MLLRSVVAVSPSTLIGADIIGAVRQKAVPKYWSVILLVNNLAPQLRLIRNWFTTIRAFTLGSLDRVCFNDVSWEDEHAST